MGSVGRQVWPPHSTMLLSEYDSFECYLIQILRKIQTFRAGALIGVFWEPL